MKQIMMFLLAFLTAATFTLTSGCYVKKEQTVVKEPAPPTSVPDNWEPSHWEWNGQEWVWVPGHYK